MPFVVTEPCINCTHTDCVMVCPMDCFVEGPNFLAIDPPRRLSEIRTMRAGCRDLTLKGAWQDRTAQALER